MHHAPNPAPLFLQEREQLHLLLLAQRLAGARDAGVARSAAYDHLSGADSFCIA